MKRIILFFAVCLGLSVSQTTFADDADAVRAASKRTSTTTVTTNQSSGRATTSNTKRADNSQNTPKNTRTAVKTQPRVVSRTTTAQVKPRENAIIKLTTGQTRNASNASRATSARTVSLRKTETNTPSFNSSSARSAVSTTSKSKRATRSAEINNEKITNIKSLNYSKCKTVYYECMDEFCANKDTNLRRCACSSRIHEFDNIKKQLSDVEDKMLDFNQRLLTVSLDKEDAAAINTPTQGELAFNKKDTSESEMLLQKITKTLNNSGDSKINNDLSAISLSLDMDTAWDSVDAFSGITTASKSGIDLYNAASPVCIEMAREVCNDDELDIAQSGYKLTIQQDCDTVAKSYKSQYNSTMEKIYESGALLDMSRLNVYQQQNSDDILTCKKKILNQLSNSTVCGENLYKCLDTTGKYIDPSTGSAFLSTDLYKLTTLLQAPEDDDKWSNVTQNESFVNFLNSKKKFLEPAIEQCQDISDMVWKDFLEDALSQIKLAQNAKLEEIRRSCTTLVSECKTSALQSLADFDARALSTFSVAADKTANGMCADIQNSCISLMDETINTDTFDWSTGMQGIATDISYQTVVETCTNVGRDCIIQQCNGTSGNFALCKNITDNNRIAILNKDVCWDRVLNCVKESNNLDNMTYVNDTYAGSEYWSDTCENDDKACYIAKQIWGNCETHQIIVPNTEPTLLSWFASNTGTTTNNYSCNLNECTENYENVNGICVPKTTAQTTDCGNPTNTKQIITVINATSSDPAITNFCASGVIDAYGNCCVSGAKNNGICVPGNNYQAAFLDIITCETAAQITMNDEEQYICPSAGDMSLYCVTDSSSDTPVTYYQTSAEYECTGDNAMWILVDGNGYYMNADRNSSDSTSTLLKPVMQYNTNPGEACPANTLPTCKYEYTCLLKRPPLGGGGTSGRCLKYGWIWSSGASTLCSAPNAALVSYSTTH